MADDRYPDLDSLVREALASRRVPEPPDTGEIEIYDEDTGWIRAESLDADSPEPSTATGTDR